MGFGARCPGVLICALRDATRTIDADDPPAHPAAARARERGEICGDPEAS
jgi:hypothetical protein